MKHINLAIIYYSMTGTNYQMAGWAAEAAKEAGANVKLLKVKETVPAEIIETNAAWSAHIEASRHIPEAQNADLEWADAILFSTPTRYGNMAALSRGSRLRRKASDCNGAGAGQSSGAVGNEP